jgi:hypothetical protein
MALRAPFDGAILSRDEFALDLIQRMTKNLSTARAVQPGSEAVTEFTDREKDEYAIVDMVNSVIAGMELSLAFDSPIGYHVYYKQLPDKSILKVKIQENSVIEQYQGGPVDQNIPELQGLDINDRKTLAQSFYAQSIWNSTLASPRGARELVGLLAHEKIPQSTACWGDYHEGAFFAYLESSNKTAS